MVGGVEGHYPSGRFADGEDRWVFGLVYASGRNEVGANEYRAFMDFHRKLAGAIEQPVVIE